MNGIQLSETEQVRRIRLMPGKTALFSEIRFPGLPWRGVISLHAAGHMGRETEERRENRARFFRLLGLDHGRVFGVTQVHGRTVLPIGSGTPDEFFVREADGLACDRPDVFLSVTAADCLPVFLFSRTGGVRALVHSGWRGTGIVIEALRVLCGCFGAPLSEIEAVIGPGIGACCYAVDLGRYDEFIKEFGLDAGTERAGLCFLDLRAANVRLLRNAGVRFITVIENCTCCETAFGSYRRDGRETYHNMLVLFGPDGGE